MAFIDILGFSNLVIKSRTECQRVPWLIKILNAVKSNEGISLRFDKKLDLQMEFTAFSDCFVLSSRIPEDPVNAALQRITFICSLLLQAGLFARGAIVEGPIYHKNNIVFGPAMIKAYKNEQSISVYPRIVVSKKLVEIYNNEIKVPVLAKLINKWSQYLIRIDQDNQYYLDTLYFIPHSLRNADTRTVLKDIKVQICKNINENENDEAVLMKYEWFKNFFNEVAVEHPELGVDTIK